MSYIHAKGRNGFVLANSTTTNELFIPNGSLTTTATILMSADAGTNTVTDIGGTPVTFTKTGTITAVSTQTPFSSTLNSVYIPGFSTGGNFYTLTNNSLRIGLGDFTLDCWVRLVTRTSTYSVIADFSPAGGSGGRANGLLYWIGSDGSVQAFHAGLNLINSGANAISTGIWYHLALVRRNGVVKLYIDGVEKSSTFGMANGNINNGACLIGRLADVAPGTANATNGYLSNWRLIRGQAIYNGDFAKPTADFTVPSLSRSWTRDYGVWKT